MLEIKNEMKLSKKDVEQYFLDNNVSVRSINDKFEMIVKAMDESSAKDRLTLMRILVHLDKELTNYESFINNEILAIKYLRELSGNKRGDMESLLSDDNLLTLLNKIKESGYNPSFSGDVLTIQDGTGNIIVEHSEKNLFDTIRGGILKFLEYKGK